jgi:hypothetical protein
MKHNGGMEVELHAFLSLALDGGECLLHAPAALLPEKEPPLRVLKMVILRKLARRRMESWVLTLESSSVHNVKCHSVSFMIIDVCYSISCRRMIVQLHSPEVGYHSCSSAFVNIMLILSLDPIH